MPGVEDPTAASLIAAAEAHHAQLRAELTERTEAFVAAVAMDQPYEWRQAELVDFLQETLRPHTEAERSLIFSRAPTGQTALLVQAMEDEHHRVTALMDEVEQAITVTDAVIAAGALVVWSTSASSRKISICYRLLPPPASISHSSCPSIRRSSVRQARPAWPGRTHGNVITKMVVIT